MKTLQRTICLFLSLVTVLILFASCGSNDSGNDVTGAGTTGAGTTATETVGTTEVTEAETTVSGTTETTEETSAEISWETDAAGYVKDNIPADADLGGEEFDILIWSENTAFLFPKSGEGNDVVSNTIYLRNLDLQNTLNCNFSAVTNFGGGNNYKDTWLAQARASGDHGYDLIGTYSRWPAILASEGLLYNLRSFDYPQTEMPWWPEELSEWEQYGALFFVTSNSSYRIIHSGIVMYADQLAIEELRLQDPLELVVTYEWTLDKLYEYTSAFHGLSIASPDTDKYYGIVVDDFTRLNGFYVGAGGRTLKNATKNGQTYAQLAYVSSSDLDKGTSILDKVIKIMDTDEGYVDSSSRKFMVNRKCAFMVCGLGDIMETADDVPYAAMPMPMFDAEQHAYKTINNHAYDVWCVPYGAEDPDGSAMLIEAFASSDYREIAPLFFERKLKMRYTRDELGERVYDIIRASYTLDLGNTCADVIGYSAGSAFCNCYKSGGLWENTYATMVQGQNNKRQLEKGLTAFLATFKQAAMKTEEEK